MSETVLPTHETLLRLCSADAPNPWYPKAYAQASGVPRGSLDALLNDLRVAGFVRLSDWQKSDGQGYMLTDLGKEVLTQPSLLAQLRTGLQKPVAYERVELPKLVTKPKAATRWDVGETARRALYEPSRPRVMPVLLALNVLVFVVGLYFAEQHGIALAQYIAQGNGPLLKEGALSGADLAHGEWWRLLTCCFLHIGLMHLVVNMYSLYILGLVESLFGSLRYLILYLLSGLGGSCVAMIWSPDVGLAGASGAIWGLMGALTAWLFLNRSHLPPRQVAAWLRSLAIAFLINVGVSMLPFVSAAAHFGGGAVGLAVATLLHVQRFGSPPRRWAAVILLLLLPFIGYAALTYSMAHNPRWQRVEQRVAQQQHEVMLFHFRQDVVPAVDQAANLFQALESTAYVATDIPPRDRNVGKGGKLSKDLSAAGGLANVALEKLGDKPLDDDRVEAARIAGRDYMQLITEQTAQFEKLLDSEQMWTPDERNKAPAELRKARTAWLEKRNQL